MNEITTLTEVLLIASVLGLLLQRLKVSPVLAYLLSGVIGTTLGINYNSSIFQFISFLAINLLSFEMGISVNLVDLRKLFRRALFIVLIEFLIVSIVVSVISLIVKLNFVSTLLLVVIGFNSSSSIAFKLAEKNLDENDLKLILSVLSMEDTVAFIVLGIVTSSTFNPLNIVLSSFASIILGYLISKLLINPTLNFSEDSVILSAVTSVFLFNIVSQLLNIPSTLASFLLGLGTSFASVNSKKLLTTLRPLVDFTLILFFFVAGSYMKFSPYIIFAIPISLILVLTKYLAFSTAYWISGIEYLRAFRTGLFVSPLSEFGIIISLTALQENLPVQTVYGIAVVIVAISSTIASLVTQRTKIIIGILTKMSNRLMLDRIDTIVKRYSSLSSLKVPLSITYVIKFSILSLALVFSSILIIYLLALFSPFLVYVTYSLVIITPTALYLLVTSTLRDAIKNNVEFKGLLEGMIIMIYLLEVIEFEIIFLKLISFNLIVLIISVALGTVITIFAFTRIKRLVEELENIF